MSYTIIQAPSEFSPAYNENIFVVGGSDNISEPNFRYVFKIFLNGATDPIIKKRYPHPVNGNAMIDVGRLVESFVTHDIDTTVFGFQTCGNSIMKYYVEFYEEFEVDGVITLSEVQFVSDIKKCWNGIINFIDGANYNQNNYLIDNSKILNHSLVREVTMDSNGWLYMLQQMSSGKIHNCYVECFDVSGDSISGVAFSSPFTNESVLANNMLRVDCSPNGLNQVPDELIFIGSQPIVPTNAVTYKVQIGYYNGEELISKGIYDFKIVDYCNDVIYPIHYLNNLGAFETFNFTKGSKRTETIKRESYKKVVGSLTESGYGYSVSDRADNTSNTVIKDTYKVRTNWLSQDNQALLEQLVSSPIVFWDSPQGVLAITIKNNSFEFDRQRIKKMLFIEIEFELSYDRYRQRY
jgi:hypothetical protein